MERNMRLDKKDLLLYAVTDRHWLGDRTLYEVVKESLDGGATFIQLREKNLDQEHFLEEARELKKLCADYKVPFVINDNVDIALMIDADGVHVGQSDMEAGDVRAKLGPDKIIGVSAQTVEQAVLAEKRGADYLGVGAVFPTGSKDDAVDVSHDTLRDICKAVSIPVIGNGDITIGEIHTNLLVCFDICVNFTHISRLPPNNLGDNIIGNTRAN
jgi:thiamine-phosphate pyrophosphorylase